MYYKAWNNTTYIFLKDDLFAMEWLQTFWLSQATRLHNEPRVLNEENETSCDNVQDIYVKLMFSLRIRQVRADGSDKSVLMATCLFTLLVYPILVKSIQ